ECLADGVGVGHEVADRAADAPPSQAVQSAAAVSRDVALHGRAAEAGDLGSLLPRQVTVQQPQNEHFSADVAVRVAIPFGVHPPLLVLGQRDPEDGPVLALGGPHPLLTSSPVRQASSLADTSPARLAISSPRPACSWRWTAR